jgi:hypothetical protein
MDGASSLASSMRRSSRQCSLVHDDISGCLRNATPLFLSKASLILSAEQIFQHFVSHHMHAGSCPDGAESTRHRVTVGPLDGPLVAGLLRRQPLRKTRHGLTLSSHRQLLFHRCRHRWLRLHFWRQPAGALTETSTPEASPTDGPFFSGSVWPRRRQKRIRAPQEGGGPASLCTPSCPSPCSHLHRVS